MAPARTVCPLNLPADISPQGFSNRTCPCFPSHLPRAVFLHTVALMRRFEWCYYPYGMKSPSENHDCQLSPTSLSNGQVLNDFQDAVRYIPGFHKIWCQANWLFCFGTGRNRQAHSQQVPGCCPDSFYQGPDPWIISGEACLQGQSSWHMCTLFLNTSSLGF